MTDDDLLCAGKHDKGKQVKPEDGVMMMMRLDSRIRLTNVHTNAFSVFNTFFPISLFRFEKLQLVHKYSTDSFLFQLSIVCLHPSFYSSHTPTHMFSVSITPTFIALSPPHTQTLTEGLTGDGIYHTTPFNPSIDRFVLSDKPLTVIYLSFTELL